MFDINKNWFAGLAAACGVSALLSTSTTTSAWMGFAAVCWAATYFAAARKEI